MLDETEAELCRRIGNKLAEEGRHDRAAAWLKMATLHADIDQEEDADEFPTESAITGLARG